MSCEVCGERHIGDYLTLYIRDLEKFRLGLRFWFEAHWMIALTFRLGRKDFTIDFNWGAWDRRHEPEEDGA